MTHHTRSLDLQADYIGDFEINIATRIYTYLPLGPVDIHAGYDAYDTRLHGVVKEGYGLFMDGEKPASLPFPIRVLANRHLTTLVRRGRRGARCGPPAYIVDAQIVRSETADPKQLEAEGFPLHMLPTYLLRLELGHVMPWATENQASL
ncbi:hypothetical protein P7L68_19785 [Tistrella mobilis]|uniref:hypothetical protein n=1 Tax=Tistrella mobilis TaxID=171437 RepID=UPI003558129D